MIVITCLKNVNRRVQPGDKFVLTINDELGCQVVIEEEIKTYKIINYAASFRFALDNGRCTCFHLAGIFANKDELPEEFKKAKMFNDLTASQQKNFIETCGHKIIRSENNNENYNSQ